MHGVESQNRGAGYSGCAAVGNPLHGVESPKSVVTTKLLWLLKNPLHGVERNYPKWIRVRPDKENPLHGVESHMY